MNWVTLSLQLLPSLIKLMEAVPGLKGHQKKAAVKSMLGTIAEGVGAVMPQHSAAAQDAALLAGASIDGVVQVLNDVGALNPHSDESSTPENIATAVADGTVTAATVAAGVAAIANEVSNPKPPSPPVVVIDPAPAVASVPDATGDSSSAPLPGPGLHNTVPA